MTCVMLQEPIAKPARAGTVDANRVKMVVLALIVCVSTPDIVSGASPVRPPGGAYTKQSVLIETADGVEVDADLYSAGNRDVVIYCHRLLAGKEGGEVERLVRALVDRYDLVAFDFRGHKSSMGTSTIGGDEVLDLRAAVALAQESGYRHVHVVGVGMGANVAWRTAAIFGNIDALVAVSPAGFAPEVSPLLVRLVSDRLLETAFGKVPLRIATNTRLGVRYTAGFPADLAALTRPVPSLIINAERDRMVNLRSLRIIFEDLPEPAALNIVPGRDHAEDLLNDRTISEIREFLDGIPPQIPDTSGYPTDSGIALAAEDALRIELTGDLPVPTRMVLDEVRERISAPESAEEDPRLALPYLESMLRDVYSIHGYTKSAVSYISSVPGPTFNVATPRIRSVAIEGNRWVSEDHIRSVIRIGHDYYNAYELDLAVRRLASDPAVRSVKPSVRERPDGDVDVRLAVVEQRPYRFMVSTKFTEIDDFVGVGLSWNEFNPTGLQYDGRAMIGVSDYALLTDHRLSRRFLANTLRVSAALFDNIKSRDDLDYLLTRQEVQELGGEMALDYRFSSSIALGCGVFGKRYRPTIVAEEMPVREGDAAGFQVKVDLSGRLPRRQPRFAWRYTTEYQRVGVGGLGDFDFETFGLNLTCDLVLKKHHSVETALRVGWISGSAPPQEQFSLGGMTSLPGYEDDAFVDTRVLFVGQSVFLSTRSLVDERSVWAPLRLVLSGHAGTVWGTEDDFGARQLRLDAGLELEYLATLRAGIVWPVGGLRQGSARAYLGWATHVL